MRRDHLNITEPLEDQVTFIVKYLDLSTLPPLPSPAQVINSDQFLMIQQLIVVIR